MKKNKLKKKEINKEKTNSHYLIVNLTDLVAPS